MSRDIASFRRRPLSIFSFDIARGLRKGAREHKIDCSHPLFSERLVDVRELGIAGENYYHKESGNPPYNGRVRFSIPHLLLRESVARLLVAADQRLHSIGLGIHVHDCFRSVDHQDHMFEVWMPEYLRREHPEWDEDSVDRERRMFWGRATNESGMIDPLSPPLHSTGGAVDLTLYDLKSKKLLPLGCGFDDFSSVHVSCTDHFERLCIDRNGVLTCDEKEVLGNRRLLYWTLSEVGFVNNPNEVWHYDYGDQMWAALRSEEAAFYSIAFLPFL